MTTLKLPVFAPSGRDDVISLNLFMSGGSDHGILPSFPMPPTWSKHTTRCSLPAALTAGVIDIDVNQQQQPLPVIYIQSL